MVTIFCCYGRTCMSCGAATHRPTSRATSPRSPRGIEYLTPASQLILGEGYFVSDADHFARATIFVGGGICGSRVTRFGSRKIHSRRMHADRRLEEHSLPGR